MNFKILVTRGMHHDILIFHYTFLLLSLGGRGSIHCAQLKFQMPNAKA